MSEEKNLLLDKIDAVLDKLTELSDDKELTKYKIETNDKEDFYMAFHGSDFYDTLWDLNQELRNTAKWGAVEQGLDVDTLDHVGSMLHEFMSDHNVDFEHVS